MSHQENFAEDVRSQDSLNFLKTVVDQDSVRAKNGTDSDKENDHSGAILTSSTKEFNFSLSSSSDTASKNPATTIMDKGDADMWDDFYNEEDFENTGKEEELSGVEHDDLMRVLNDRVLEKVEEEEEDYVDESNATDTIESHNNVNTKENTDSRLSDEDSADRKTKRKRKKKLFKRIRQPLSPRSRTQPIGGSHPNLGEHSRSRSNSSTDQHSNHFETMSDTSGSQRKLGRRKQVSRPRCAGPSPNGDRLEQKYQELEHLMLKPLANPAVYVKQTRQQMIRLQGLSSNTHYNSSHDPASLPPRAQLPVTRDSSKITSVIQVIEEDTNQAYSTMRTVQVVHGEGVNGHARPNATHPRRKPLSRPRVRRPQSAGQIRPQTSGQIRPQSAGQFRPITATNSNGLESGSVLTTINSNNSNNNNNNNSNNNNNNNFSSSNSSTRGRRRNTVKSDSSVSGGSHRVSDRSESGSKERGYTSASSFEDGTGSRSDSQSPGRSPGRNFQTTETHLKNSSNPALRQWLKVKDKEYRKKKMEERKKKRKERVEKQEEELKKQEFLEKGEEKVKEWMTQKRKEAWKQAKEERKRIKEEEKELAERQQKYTDSLTGKMFIPIRRPDGKYEKENKKSDQQQQQQQDNATTTPQPPKSKFVYKRPVSGRVRLMKLQQERKEDSKKLDAKKKETEKMMAEEKERKMRMSYDQWLIKKRGEDYSKRQEAARQKLLAKSDPELDRIVPEMARRRAENIRRGKKRIETGDSSLDRSVNKSFGGGDFGEGEANGVPRYRLEVTGDKKSLKSRPSSAKSAPPDGMLNPKQSKSPRRPQSANPRVQALMNDSQDSSLNPDNSFKLPFPPELGIPKYVAAKQEKLFSETVMSNASPNVSISQTTDVEEPNEPPVSVSSCDQMQGSSTQETEVDSHSKSQGDAEMEVDSLSPSTTDKRESEQQDESFFVTHGNVHTETEQAESSKEMEDCENVQEKEDAAAERLDTELVDDDSQSSLEEKGQNDLSEGRDDSNIIPPLEIGDDDRYLRYGEEYNEENIQEEMDLTGTTDLNDKEEGLPTRSKSINDVGKVSKSSEVKSSIKHVSFSEETTIHNDPLAGLCDHDYFYDHPSQEDIENDDYDDDDDDDDDNDDNQTNEYRPLPESLDDDGNFDDGDVIEGYQDDEEEEDERGFDLFD